MATAKKLMYCLKKTVNFHPSETLLRIYMTLQNIFQGVKMWKESEEPVFWCKKKSFSNYLTHNSTTEFTKQHDILMVDKMQEQIEKVKPHSKLVVRKLRVFPVVAPVAERSVKNRIQAITSAR